jgi:N-acyl homoserine lactone hydrolase
VNRVDVLIQPVVLRFTLQEDELVYLFAADADAQLDRMERMMGIDPGEQMLFESNLGFLPASTAVLIRGERTIVVDPGNHHTGFYGQLALALQRHDLTPDDVDLVVSTHCHHDHMASISVFEGTPLVLGEREIDFSHELYGAAETERRIQPMGEVSEVPLGGELKLADGVAAPPPPGPPPPPRPPRPGRGPPPQRAPPRPRAGPPRRPPRWAHTTRHRCGTD